MSESLQQQRDDFAAQASERYDALISWMIDQWPQQSDPLVLADFVAGKREMGLLLGAKLNANGEYGRPGAEVGEKTKEVHTGQYLPITPAPWP